MNSSAEDLTDFKSAKSNLRNIASFPVCSFSSAMADFTLSSLRAAMYTFALWASNTCMFLHCQSHGLVGIEKDLPLPFLFQSLFEDRVLFISIFVPLRIWFCNTPEFAPVTMMTFPVKSGMSSTLNLLWGGNVCEKIEVIRPIGGERYLGRNEMLHNNPYKTVRNPHLQRVSGLAVLTLTRYWKVPQCRNWISCHQWINDTYCVRLRCRVGKTSDILISKSDG